MFSSPGSRNRIEAEFETRLLTINDPPADDPVEDHMNRVRRLVSRWGVLLLIVASGATWISDATTAAFIVALLTVPALLFAWRRTRDRGPATGIVQEPSTT